MPRKSKRERKEYNKAWHKKNREHVRAYRRNRGFELKEAVYTLYGKRCARCGIADIRVLQIDHVFGGGSKEKRAIGHNQHSFYSLILKHPERYQLLCANCNWIKRIEEKEARIMGDTLKVNQG